MVLEQSERGTGESYRNDFIEEPSAVIRDYYADPQGITGFSDMATMEIKERKSPNPSKLYSTVLRLLARKPKRHARILGSSLTTLPTI